jgi:hypothetical protein
MASASSASGPRAARARAAASSASEAGFGQRRRQVGQVLGQFAQVALHMPGGDAAPQQPVFEV